jgi:SAM-dependent methyltransferase
VEGYEDETYGEAFADVYDEWYGELGDLHTTVEALAELAHDGRVLELGVGTGRIAVPLAERLGAGRVAGIDASATMLDRLASNDPAGLVERHLGDMGSELPPGPFALVVVAYNTFFNLDTRDRQATAMRHVAARLAPGGRLVVEAFAADPDDDGTTGNDVELRSMTTTSVVLSVSRRHLGAQIAEGQFIELSAAGVRLRPWRIRWSTVDELDEMAAAADLVVEHRWEDFARRPFTSSSSRHVTVYRATSDAASGA